MSEGNFFGTGCTAMTKLRCVAFRSSVMQVLSKYNLNKTMIDITHFVLSPVVQQNAFQVEKFVQNKNYIIKLRLWAPLLLRERRP